MSLLSFGEDKASFLILQVLCAKKIAQTTPRLHPGAHVEQPGGKEVSDIRVTDITDI